MYTQSEKVAIRIKDIFNIISYQSACKTCKQMNFSSYHFVTLELLTSCSSISNFRYVLNVTNGFERCPIERFNTLHDLLQYVHTYNIGLDFNVHQLISILP